MGFDANGNLYVANTGTSKGKNAITVYKAPISNSKPYYLKGVTAPSGLTFDKSGNLFVSSNGTTGAIAEYASDHLKSGSAPSIVDSTGLASDPYGADLNFDAAGNLYDADCSSTPGIYSYPTATKKFSSSLAPVLHERYDHDNRVRLGSRRPLSEVLTSKHIEANCRDQRIQSRALTQCVRFIVPT